MPIVSSGQITITDQTDAKTLTGTITPTASPSTYGPNNSINGAKVQQTYDGSDSVDITWIPDRTVSTLRLTAKVSVSKAAGAKDVTAELTNKVWSLDAPASDGEVGGAILSASASAPSGVTLPNVSGLGASGTYMEISDNTVVDVVTTPYRDIYFEADYTDPATGLTTHIVLHKGISAVRSGTNAIYVRIDGATTIERADDITKNFTIISANLINKGAVDDSDTKYKWYEITNGIATQIKKDLPSVNLNYGFMDTATYNGNNINGAVGTYTTNGGPSSGGSDGSVSTSNIGAAFADTKAIVIAETAVLGVRLFKVKAEDNGKTSYEATFTIIDKNDPYQVTIESNSGDKLQNGTGSLTLTPVVRKNNKKIDTVAANWSFDWYFYDKNGKRGGFVDELFKTGTDSGQTITGNGTASGAGAYEITYSGTTRTLSGDQIIKCLKPDGNAVYYEVASSSTNKITVRNGATNTNTWLTFANFPFPTGIDELKGGKIFRCDGKITAPTITIDGDDIDMKGNITVDAIQPDKPQ